MFFKYQVLHALFDNHYRAVQEFFRARIPFFLRFNLAGFFFLEFATPASQLLMVYPLVNEVKHASQKFG